MDNPTRKMKLEELATRFWSQLSSKPDEALVSLTIRAFLFAFLPVCAVLIASLLATQKAVQEGITDGVRESLRRFEGHLKEKDTEEAQRSHRALATLVRNSEFRRTMEALEENPSDQNWRQQNQDMVAFWWDQVADLLGDDFFLLTNSQGQPIVSQVFRGEPIPLDSFSLALRTRDLSCDRCHTPPALLVGGTLYDAETTHIQGTSGILGTVTIGKKFDIHSLVPFGNAVVENNGKILLSTFSAGMASEIEREIRKSCPGGNSECELEIGGESYHVLRVSRANMWGSFRLLAFYPLDQEKEQFLQYFNRLFYGILVGSLILVLGSSVVASYFLSRPIAKLVAHLRQSEQTGQLQPIFPMDSMAKEINWLARSLNGAARAVQKSHERLTKAYLEFLETLAGALDARDSYTAGHSDRVSVNSTAIAELMGLSGDQVEIIRIGAKLHDIGKIGIPDKILQKPDRLTREEFAVIQRHPQTGKGILERVGHFRDYLPIVELHHENYDGSGYPYGLAKEEIPLGVRIVHVADVYDAITSERAYRKPMSEQEAEQLLVNGAGTEFDPSVVETFLHILHQRRTLSQMLEKVTQCS